MLMGVAAECSPGCWSGTTGSPGSGLAIVLYVAVKMISEGSREVADAVRG